MERKIVGMIIFGLLLLSMGCKSQSGTGGGSSSDGGSTMSAGASFEIDKMDWQSKGCNMAEDECEKRKNNNMYNAACARIMYTAEPELACHLYINEKLRIDDPLSIENRNIGRVYKFVSGGSKVLELRDDNFLFFYDTKIKICCVPSDETERLKDKDYAVCKETKLVKMCE